MVSEFAADCKLIVFALVTVKVPEALAVEHPPVKVTVYAKDPVTEGVPLIVIVLFDQVPVTPAGKPLKLAPVAPVVL